MEDFADNEILLIKWLNNELTAQERKDFEASDDFKYYKYIYEETGNWALPKIKLSESYNTLSGKKAQTKSGKSIRVNFGKWSLGIAATLILLVSFFIYKSFTNDLVIHKTAAGEAKEIALPDGSTIYLNAGSEISFRTRTYGKKRAIQLKGTAYFDVEKGGAFEVTSDHGIVAVKGTEFEISDGPEFYNVACLEGRVEVTLSEIKEKVSLDSSDVITYTRRKGLNKSKTSSGKHHSWKSGKSNFTNAPLSQVFNSIEKQFGVSIDDSKIDTEMIFTGEFFHTNIEAALKMVCTPMQISYTIDGDKIVLKTNK